MATLVLTAVGTAIGGPLGGALGGLLGQGLDARVFGGGKRTGPRLKELDVQTSSYGSQIPRIYGKMRVAGSVIWATDLIETRQKEGGGKGKPKITAYSYSANLAVALSSAPISNIGHIWADGKLLRGAAGDFKSATEFRLYRGHGDQPLDPLIASAQGSGNASAHRDLSYAVFEGLQLEDFGNRIPSLTFEVIQNDGAVDLVDIASDIEDFPFDIEPGFVLDGFAVAGEELRDSWEPLTEIADHYLQTFGECPIMRHTQDDATVLDRDDFLLDAGGEHLTPEERHMVAIGNIPAGVSLRHYDESRDYQSGQQSHARSGPGSAVLHLDFPAVIDATRAKSLAANLVHRKLRERETITIHLPKSSTVPRAGSRIRLADSPTVWRVEEVEHQPIHVRISARRSAGDTISIASAQSGQSVHEPDLLPGPTHLVAMDIPNIGEVFRDSVMVGVAASGESTAWRRAALSLDRGAGLEPLGATAGAAPMGQSLSALPWASPYLIDRQNMLDVQLFDQSIILTDADSFGLWSGQNLAWISGELIQFETALPLGEGRYRLSGLRRGLFGSDHRMSGHSIGENFVILEADTILLLDDRNFSGSEDIALVAEGIGDGIAVEAELSLSGEAIRPLSPVHPTVKKRVDGGMDLSWIRRSRHHLTWRDGIDMPLAEEREQYVIRLTDAEDVELLFTETSQSSLDLSVGDASLWSARPAPVIAEVRQIGRWMLSDPLTFPITF